MTSISINLSVATEVGIEAAAIYAHLVWIMQCALSENNESIKDENYFIFKVDNEYLMRYFYFDKRRLNKCLKKLKLKGFIELEKMWYRLPKIAIINDGKHKYLADRFLMIS